MNLFYAKLIPLLTGQYYSGYNGDGPDTMQLGLVVAGVVIICFVSLLLVALRIKKVGPNESMIISGLRNRLRDSSGNYKYVNFRVQQGGATFIWPFIERVDRLSMELVTINVGTGDRFEIGNVPLRIEGTVEIKIMTDPSSIMIAAELFLNSGTEEIKRVGTHIVDGKIRAALNSLTITELSANHDGFVERVRGGVEADLGNMGLEVSGFAIYVSDIPKVEGGFRAGEEELRQL